MKAVRLHEFGGAENLKIEETDQPSFTDSQVFVKVYAASVNQFEIKVASGNMQKMVPVELPFIPGSDFAGVIEQVGKNVTGFKVGDEVYGQSANFGAYAEYLVAESKSIALKPKSLDWVQAASVPVVALTAYQGLFLHGHLKAGQTVLIHGAAGAVGAYAVQLAKNGGAHVMATASGVDVDFLHRMGAEKVFAYETDKFEDQLQGVDLVLDLIGGETQQRSYAVMKEGGKLVATSQPPSQEEAQQHGVSAMMMNMQANTEDLNELAVLIDEGILHIDVAKVYPMEEVAEAWKAIAGNISKDGTKGKKIGHGKAVLKIAD
jgi:NADPH:quinone reductase-like Zn-dependent oxidoreductase